ncbi:Rz1-like lysis system protein LysC [Klebsiella oxytoca]|uniref:Rz1-like lysis system protein LysC n=1 Tax=Klebsiella oxytoca TaxID=571 RepID=UPI003BF87F2B
MVKTPIAPIPESLLIDCSVPMVPTAMTFGDSVQMNIALLNALDACNGQVRTIRQIESSRNIP